MAEAIISRRGYTAEGKPELRTETIAVNQVWKVPSGVRGTVSVRLFGGGGGGNICGGGSGWMNYGEISVSPNQQIQITIGAGGNVGVSGGTTSFGTYLSANGGSAGTAISGGSGGAGGGGGGWASQTNGGDGYQFGGGGALSTLDDGVGRNGGNGGTYGGGGGGATYGIMIYNNSYIYPSRSNFGRGGNGGTYGGGGAGIVPGAKGTYGGAGGGGYNFPMTNARNPIAASNGTNTIGLEEVDINLQGPGTRGNWTYNGWYVGGPGASDRYDRNDYWNRILSSMINPVTQSGYGAGGGYGGKGGSSYYQYEFAWSSRLDFQFVSINSGGGGGGGYGGNGGNCDWICGGGGGGGYGKGADGGNGGNPTHGPGGGGGGGYFSKGGDPINNGNYYGDMCGGGGGGYGPGGDGHQDGGIAAGGGGMARGGSGICIIQYYQ